MTTYVAFLRGINVGAHNRMKMAELRECCESLGFADVQTYIQSGNVVFETPETDAATLESELADAIQDSLGYDISVMVRTRAELDEVVANRPFDEPRDEHTKLYVTFLDEAPGDEQVEALLAAQDEAEAFEVRGREVYSRLRKDLMEDGRFTDIGKTLGTSATRRTWNVVERVWRMGSA